MLILGLGTNEGDRLTNLRQALHAIRQLPQINITQISPIYLSDALVPENAPPDWNSPYLNMALRCETTLAPLALLQQLKNIEHTIGRKPAIRHWGPRIIDIDILAWDDLILQSDVLTIPHKHLPERPFALWPLADVAPLWQFPLEGVHYNKTAAQIVEPWGSRFNGEAPFHTKQIHQRVDIAQLVGAVNITPDSFSDGGQFMAVDRAVQHIVQLVADGAEVIDIGAESTAPNATSIDAKTEWQRLAPVLAMLKQQQFIIPPKISIDTRHAATAQQALAWGADWINDVSGLDGPAMRELIAHSKKDCVVMHHIKIPEQRTHVIPRNADPIKIVYAWGEQRINELAQQGIAREKIIFDPGIGFGKMAEQSLILLQHIDAFKTLGTRILVGHSRKSPLSLFTSAPFAERDIETMAMALCLAKKVDYLRVHNVAICARGFKVISAFPL